MNKRLWLLALLLFSLAATGAPLRLNTDIFPPYQVQEGDQLTGSSVKALACIFAAMGRDYEIRVLPWQRAVHEVRQDKAAGFFSATRMNNVNNFATLSAPLALEKWYWYSNTEQRPPTSGDTTTLRIGGVRGRLAHTARLPGRPTGDQHCTAAIPAQAGPDRCISS